MSRRSILLILCPLALLLTTYRLPAPISEVQPPTPAPHQSAKPKSQPIQAAAKRETGLTASETSEIATKLKELENKRVAFLTTHDLSVLKSLLADNFVCVWSNGKVLNKEAYLDEFKSDTNIYESAVNESVDVHVSNRTMAVVTGTSRLRGKTKSGAHFDSVLRFTHTWTERNGVWKCTASQFVLVSSR